MRTRINQSLVSVARTPFLPARAALLAAVLGLGACAGRQRATTQTEVQDTALRSDVLQFDNQATVYVDVYIAWAGRQLQWRLGRVLPGMRTTLRIPESAIDQTLGFVQLAVIPGSQMSAEAWRDPRAVMAIAQPMSEVLSQRWTFRQPAGAGLQLQATRLPRR